MSLDPQQRAAVETGSENVLVIAGAGSGKTRVLTERIAYLIETQKVSPFEILSFSFTRKASGEIRERLDARIGGAAYKCYLGTIHSIALQMLRKFGETVGLQPDKITIYSEWESSFLLREVATEIGVRKRGWIIPKKEIDAAFAIYYERGVEPDRESKIYPLFDVFMQRCRENNALTYGALLIGLEMLIPTMARFMRIRHILVDEVQDIDPLQWRIINGMKAAFGCSLFVVGDIRQSIYSFRGAVPEYLLEHRSEFQVYELQTNYRSVPPIVSAANRLMEHSSVSMGGGMNHVRPHVPYGVDVCFNIDSAALATMIADDFQSENIAVLARNHALLKKLSAELESRSVDHTYIGQKSALTNSEEFRRFHAFLKLLVNPYDNFSFMLIRGLIGLTPREYADIRFEAAQEGESHLNSWLNSYIGGADNPFRDFFQAAGDGVGLLATSVAIKNIFMGGHFYPFPAVAYDIEDTFQFIVSWAIKRPPTVIRDYLDWLATYDIQDEIT